MDKPYRPPNTMPFIEPAFYIDPRQVAQVTVEAAKDQAQTTDNQDNVAAQSGDKKD